MNKYNFLCLIFYFFFYFNSNSQTHLGAECGEEHGWIHLDDGCYYCDGNLLTQFDADCLQYAAHLDEPCGHFDLIGWIFNDDGCYYCDGDTFTLFDLTCSSLPVELISFGIEVLEKEVTLNWQTATEQNNYGFEVERAVVSGQLSAWETIGFVEGNGNSNSPKEYSFVDESVSDGKYSYRLKQIDNDAKYSYSNEVEIEVANIPTDYVLFQNYPNPFNPSTTIKYSIPTNDYVSLRVYDILGNELANLVNNKQSAGNYEVKFDGGKFASGIYYYRSNTGEYSACKKLLILK